MAVASAGNKILFAGGYSTGSLSTRVDIFDFAANTWSTAELSSQRRRIAAVAAGNKIFFAGGVIMRVVTLCTQMWISTMLLPIPGHYPT